MANTSEVDAALDAITEEIEANRALAAKLNLYSSQLAPGWGLYPRLMQMLRQLLRHLRRRGHGNR